MTKIRGGSVLVSGASRGLGRALVEEAVARGATRVYAGFREPATSTDPRVVPVLLNVIDGEQIRAATEAVSSLDVLINNAGVALRPDDLSNRALLERHFAVNFWGVYDLTRALIPALAASGGTVLNVLSTASWVSLPMLPGYSASKAAAFSLTQGLRTSLAADGIRVSAAMVGAVDTDMTRGFPGARPSPADVAARILDGLERDEDEIFPDAASAGFADVWRSSAFKAMEETFAGRRRGRKER
ncbi:SDR family NAD(P)-dependent oxidoreductase [Arthrobacter sp. NPDC058097]|uniref:SDR family NAD(P)-dependent oxidoreductase n=1 Tax=Arthrobacter sp. NPDC058097 TaxID=3346340 RepID=UPI0036DCBE68